MKKFLLLLILMGAGTVLYAQPKRAFRLTDRHGHKVSYRKLLKKAARADVVFFGELHNNPIAHWLELELTQDLYRLKKGRIILGAEMFERDNQEALDRYLRGEIDAKGLDTLARLWPNFKTDYKPLVDFAKAHGIPFIATNIPRRYASQVFHHGLGSLDSLPAAEKRWIARLPIAYDSTLSQYAKMRKMMPSHRGANLPKAQAIKDATMAESIARALKPGYTFIHFNGSYHSAYHQGIVWYLKRLKPDIKILTIETVTAEDIRRLPPGVKNTADFIIIVDKDMTTTY